MCPSTAETGNWHHKTSLFALQAETITHRFIERAYNTEW